MTLHKKTRIKIRFDSIISRPIINAKVIYNPPIGYEDTISKISERYGYSRFILKNWFRGMGIVSRGESQEIGVGLQALIILTIKHDNVKNQRDKIPDARKKKVGVKKTRSSAKRKG